MVLWLSNAVHESDRHVQSHRKSLYDGHDPAFLLFLSPMASTNGHEHEQKAETMRWFRESTLF